MIYAKSHDQSQGVEPMIYQKFLRYSYNFKLGFGFFLKHPVLIDEQCHLNFRLINEINET